MKFLLTENQYFRVINKDLKIINNLLGEQEKKDEKKADLVSDDVNIFFKTLESINEPLVQQKKGSYTYEKNVETFQIALILLGFDLPKYGVDGKFGPETANAYQQMIDSGILDTEKTVTEALSEFKPSGGITVDKNVDTTIDSNLQKLIVDIQSKFGLPIKITSAYRDPKKNIRIGGAKNSAHMTHYAVDVTFSGDREKTLEFAKIASSLGTLGIGIYRAGSVHIDIDNTKGRRSWGPGFMFSGVPRWAKETLTLHNKGFYSKGNVVNPSGQYTVSTELDTKPSLSDKISGIVTVQPETVKMMSKVLRKKGINSEDIQQYINIDNPETF